MGEIINLQDQQPHKTSEVICVKCGYRWLAVRPVETKLKDLQCPLCKEKTYTIETGEIITND